MVHDMFDRPFKYNGTKQLIYDGLESQSRRYFFLVSVNTCYDTSLEPSRRDGSNQGSQYVL